MDKTSERTGAVFEETLRDEKRRRVLGNSLYCIRRNGMRISHCRRETFAKEKNRHQWKQKATPGLG